MAVRCGRFLILLALAAALVAGCGDFWQAPTGSTSTGVTGSTASTTTVTASTTTPTTGASITLTATVSPSTATGTVTFYNNSTSIGSASLASGTAALTTSFSAAGTESITATYGGSSTYASSTSSAITITVSASTSPIFVPTRTRLDASASAPQAGESVTLTATVFPSNAGGTVSFYDGSVSPERLLGIETVSSGTASLTTAFETAGTHAIIATYSGSSIHANSSAVRALGITMNQ